MELIDFIRPELITLIPVMYFIGIAFKKSKIPDHWIPFILGGISILICSLWVCATSDTGNIRDMALALFISITQGVLTAGNLLKNHLSPQHLSLRDCPISSLISYTLSPTQKHCPPLSCKHPISQSPLAAISQSPLAASIPPSSPAVLSKSERKKYF